MEMTGAVCVLLAQEDARQRAMTRDALREGRAAFDLHAVTATAELAHYLATPPRPQLVLLDLAVAGAEEALAAAKADPATRRIPFVVLGGPDRDDEQIARCYDLGAAAYMTKPVTFLDLVEAMKALSNWWLDTVALPPAA
jgi:two-component system response regulator